MGDSKTESDYRNLRKTLSYGEKRKLYSQRTKELSEQANSGEISNEEYRIKSNYLWMQLGLDRYEELRRSDRWGIIYFD